MNEEQKEFMHKVPVFIVAVIAILIFAVAVITFISIAGSFKSDDEPTDQTEGQTGTETIEVCTEGNYPSGADYYECTKYDNIQIIKGTDQIQYDYIEECAKYDAEPYMEVVGGVVGIQFRGCVVNE